MQNSQNKKSFYPSRDKSLNFCGTTQIDDKSPTHFAYHHMHPTDNGQGSRRRLIPTGFEPPSQVHSICSGMPLSHQPRLSVLPSPTYFSCSSVLYIKLFFIYKNITFKLPV